MLPDGLLIGLIKKINNKQMKKKIIYFHKIHPLQTGYWREFRPSTCLISKLICELRGEGS